MAHANYNSSFGGPSATNNGNTSSYHRITGGSSIRELEDHLNPSDFAVGLTRQENDRMKRSLEKSKNKQQQQQNNEGKATTTTGADSARSVGDGPTSSEAILTEIESALLHVVRTPRMEDIHRPTPTASSTTTTSVTAAAGKSISNTKPNRVSIATPDEQGLLLDGANNGRRGNNTNTAAASPSSSSDTESSTSSSEDSPPEVFLSEFQQQQQARNGAPLKADKRRDIVVGSSRKKKTTGKKKTDAGAHDNDVRSSLSTNATVKRHFGRVSVTNDESFFPSSPAAAGSPSSPSAAGGKSSRSNKRSTSSVLGGGSSPTYPSSRGGNNNSANSEPILKSKDCDEIVELLMFSSDLMKHDLFSLMELFSTPFEEQNAVERFAQRWEHVLNALSPSMFPAAGLLEAAEKKKDDKKPSSSKKKTVGSGKNTDPSHKLSNNADEEEDKNEDNDDEPKSPTIGIRAAVVASAFSAKLLSRVRLTTSMSGRRASSIAIAMAEAEAEANGQMTATKAAELQKNFAFVEGIKGMIRSTFQYSMEELALRHQEKYQNAFSHVSYNDAMFTAIDNTTKATQHAIKMEARNKLLATQLETAQKQLATMKESYEQNVHNYYKELMQVRQKMMDLQKQQGDTSKVAELLEHPSRMGSGGNNAGGAQNNGNADLDTMRGAGVMSTEKHLQYINRKLTVECAVLNHTLVQRDNVIRALEREVEKSRAEVARAKLLASEALIKDEAVDATLEEAGKLMDVIATLHARIEAMELEMSAKDEAVRESETKMFTAKAKLAMLEVEMEEKQKHFATRLEILELENKQYESKAAKAQDSLKESIAALEDDLMAHRLQLSQLRKDHQEELEANYKSLEETNAMLEGANRRLLEVEQQGQADIAAKDVHIAERDRLITQYQAEVERMSRMVAESAAAGSVHIAGDNNSSTNPHQLVFLGEEGGTADAPKSRPMSAALGRKGKSASQNSLLNRSGSQNINSNGGFISATEPQHSTGSNAAAEQALRERNEADKIAFANEQTANYVSAVADLEAERDSLKNRFDIEKGKWETLLKQRDMEKSHSVLEVEGLKSHVKQLEALIVANGNSNNGGAVPTINLVDLQEQRRKDNEALQRKFDAEKMAMEEANDAALKKLLQDKRHASQQGTSDRLRRLSMQAEGRARSPFGAFLPMDHLFREGSGAGSGIPRPSSGNGSPLHHQHRASSATSASAAGGKEDDARRRSNSVGSDSAGSRFCGDDYDFDDLTSDSKNKKKSSAPSSSSAAANRQLREKLKSISEAMRKAGIIANKGTMTSGGGEGGGGYDFHDGIEDGGPHHKGIKPLYDASSYATAASSMSPQMSPQNLGMEWSMEGVGGGANGAISRTATGMNGPGYSGVGRTFSMSSARSTSTSQQHGRGGASKKGGATSNRMKQLSAMTGGGGSAGGDAYLIAQLRAEVERLRKQQGVGSGANNLGVASHAASPSTRSPAVVTLHGDEHNHHHSGGNTAAAHRTASSSSRRSKSIVASHQQHAAAAAASAAGAKEKVNEGEVEPQGTAADPLTNSNDPFMSPRSLLLVDSNGTSLAGSPRGAAVTNNHHAAAGSSGSLLFGMAADTSMSPNNNFLEGEPARRDNDDTRLMVIRALNRPRDSAPQDTTNGQPHEQQQTRRVSDALPPSPPFLTHMPTQAFTAGAEDFANNNDDADAALADILLKRNATLAGGGNNHQQQQPAEDGSDVISTTVPSSPLETAPSSSRITSANAAAKAQREKEEGGGTATMVKSTTGASDAERRQITTNTASPQKQQQQGQRLDLKQPLPISGTVSRGAAPPPPDHHRPTSDDDDDYPSSPPEYNQVTSRSQSPTSHHLQHHKNKLIIGGSNRGGEVGDGGGGDALPSVSPTYTPKSTTLGVSNGTSTTTAFVNVKPLELTAHVTRVHSNSTLTAATRHQGPPTGLPSDFALSGTSTAAANSTAASALSPIKGTATPPPRYPINFNHGSAAASSVAPAAAPAMEVSTRTLHSGGNNSKPINSRPSSAPTAHYSTTTVAKNQLIPVARPGSSAANRLHSALSSAASAADGSVVQSPAAPTTRPLKTSQQVVINTADLFPGLEAAAEHYDLFECVAKLKFSLSQLIDVCEADIAARHQQAVGAVDAVDGEDTEQFVRNQMLEKFNIFRNLDSFGTALLNKLNKKKENILRRREDQLEGVLGALQNISLTHPKEAKVLKNQLSGKRTMSVGQHHKFGSGGVAAANRAGGAAMQQPLPIMQMELLPKPRPSSAMDGSLNASAAVKNANSSFGGPTKRASSSAGVRR